MRQVSASSSEFMCQFQGMPASQHPSIVFSAGSAAQVLKDGKYFKQPQIEVRSVAHMAPRAKSPLRPAPTRHDSDRPEPIRS